MIEPVFAHTKFNRGINRFLRRGRSAVRVRVAINHRDAQPPEAPQTPDRHQRGLTSPATAPTADQAADDTARRIPPDGRRNPFSRQPQPKAEATLRPGSRIRTRLRLVRSPRGRDVHAAASFDDEVVFAIRGEDADQVLVGVDDRADRGDRGEHRDTSV